MYKIGDDVWVSKKDKKYKGTIEELSSYEDNWYLVRAMAQPPPTISTSEWANEDDLSLYEEGE